MKRRRDSTLRQEVTATVLIATLFFLLALGTAAVLQKKVPEWREAEFRTALASGDLAAARAAAKELGAGERAALTECDYTEAMQWFGGGYYDQAKAIFSALGNYRDSAELVEECIYLHAEQDLAMGDLDGAAELFASAAGYKDSALREQQTRYTAAQACLDRGEASEAMNRFLALGGFSDARERAVTIAREITGEEDPDRAILLTQALSPEEADRLQDLQKRRDALPGQVIDVGFYHTVGLRSDGTVLACGRNEEGQCAVDSWRDITAVAAGAYHTVGLRSDGTVVACGRNTENQCDVGQWRDIVAVTASDWATFGLRRDGTVTVCGYNASVMYYMLPGWTGIERIAGGSHNVGAIRADGTALLSHVSGRSEELTGLVELAVNTAFAVGLRVDGSVVSPTVELPGWGDMLRISASGSTILGMTRDGHVRGHFFRPGDALPVEELSDVTAVAAGGTHCAFVLDDGTVTVLGESSQGQADTGEWRLFGE